MSRTSSSSSSFIGSLITAFTLSGCGNDSAGDTSQTEAASDTSQTEADAGSDTPTTGFIPTTGEPDESTSIAATTSTVPSRCGDGIVEPDEACDDGNTDDTDACLATCTLASCGDGVVQVGVEGCDDGNTDDTDACLAICTLASCGDGVVQAGVEVCDDANLVDTDACTTACALAACGDGIVQAGVEACDDGNTDDLDLCDNTCVQSACGDGKVQVGEACDDANQVDTDACTAACAPAACGDGIVHAGVEACDDANQVDTDACLAGCVAATCGDAVLHIGVEACDDGNKSDGDACLGDCTMATCGDGVVWLGFEDCDDGNQYEGDGCLSDCAHASSCAAIHAADPAVNSGVYYLNTGEGLFMAYCDMGTDGGGWTLVARFANNDTRSWMQDMGEWWYTQTAVSGEPTIPTLQQDAYSPAFHQVVGDDFKLTRTDKSDGHLLQTTNGCLDGQTFREHITGYGDFSTDVAWATDGVQGGCPVDLAGDWQTTNGFAYAKCSGTIGAPNTISFWADWSVGDGAVMMIGGGGGICNGADHGIGITEAASANFSNGVLEDDFGVEGDDGFNNNNYALNLFVR